MTITKNVAAAEFKAAVARLKDMIRNGKTDTTEFNDLRAYRDEMREKFLNA